MDTEILVHIKASSRAADDKRYVSIAQSVLEFSPVSVTKVTCDHYDGDDTTDHWSPCHAGTPNVSGSYESGEKQADIPQPSPSLKRKRPEDEASTHISRVSDTFTISRAIRARRHVHFPERTNNPPYRNPLRGRPTENCAFASPTAISSDGEQVGPDVLPQILVPDTEKRARRDIRARSGSPKTSKTAVVPDSQPGCRTRAYWQPPVRYLKDTSCLGIDRMYGRPSPGGESLITQACTNSQPEPSSHESHLHRNKQALVQIRCSSSPPVVGKENQGHGTHGITKVAPFRWTCPQACSQERIQSEDLRVFDFEPCGSARSNTSTRGATYISKQHSFSESLHHGPSDEAVHAGQASRERYGKQTEVDDDSSFRESAQPGFTEVDHLPLYVTGPSPSRHQIAAPSFDTSVLRATANGLGMPHHFKPEVMVRDVGEKERGYWKIPIDIVTPERASRTRSLSIRPQLEGRYSPWRPLLKCPDLTEKEFVSVWNELSGYVSSGNAGWSVRIMRRGLTVTYDQDPVNDQARLYLQIYCYGDAIPYIYAMLLVCSRMHVLCKRLQWVSTLDGKPIITMTGEENHGGNLGQWIRRSDRHGNTVWGCHSGP